MKDFFSSYIIKSVFLTALVFFTPKSVFSGDLCYPPNQILCVNEDGERVSCYCAARFSLTDFEEHVGDLQLNVENVVSSGSGTVTERTTINQACERARNNLHSSTSGRYWRIRGGTARQNYPKPCPGTTFPAELPSALRTPESVAGGDNVPENPPGPPTVARKRYAVRVGRQSSSGPRDETYEVDADNDSSFRSNFRVTLSAPGSVQIRGWLLDERYERISAQPTDYSIPGESINYVEQTTSNGTQYSRVDGPWAHPRANAAVPGASSGIFFIKTVKGSEEKIYRARIAQTQDGSFLNLQQVDGEGRSCAAIIANSPRNIDLGYGADFDRAYAHEGGCNSWQELHFGGTVRAAAPEPVGDRGSARRQVSAFKRYKVTKTDGSIVVLAGASDARGFISRSGNNGQFTFTRVYCEGTDLTACSSAPDTRTTYRDKIFSLAEIKKFDQASGTGQFSPGAPSENDIATARGGEAALANTDSGGVTSPTGRPRDYFDRAEFGEDARLEAVRQISLRQREIEKAKSRLEHIDADIDRLNAQREGFQPTDQDQAAKSKFIQETRDRIKGWGNYDSYADGDEDPISNRAYRDAFGSASPDSLSEDQVLNWARDHGGLDSLPVNYKKQRDIDQQITSLRSQKTSLQSDVDTADIALQRDRDRTTRENWEKLSPRERAELVAEHDGLFHGNRADGVDQELAREKSRRENRRISAENEADKNLADDDSRKKGRKADLRRDRCRATRSFLEAKGKAGDDVNSVKAYRNAADSGDYSDDSYVDCSGDESTVDGFNTFAQIGEVAGTAAAGAAGTVATATAAKKVTKGDLAAGNTAAAKAQMTTAGVQAGLSAINLALGAWSAKIASDHSDAVEKLSSVDTDEKVYKESGGNVEGGDAQYTRAGAVARAYGMGSDAEESNKQGEALLGETIEKHSVVQQKGKQAAVGMILKGVQGLASSAGLMASAAANLKAKKELQQQRHQGTTMINGAPKVPDSQLPPPLLAGTPTATSNAATEAEATPDELPNDETFLPPSASGSPSPGGLKDPALPASNSLVPFTGSGSGGGAGGGGGGGLAGGGGGSDDQRQGSSETLSGGGDIKFQGTGGGASAGYASTATQAKKSEGTGMDINGLLGALGLGEKEDQTPDRATASIKDFANNNQGNVGPGSTHDDGSILGPNSNVFARISTVHTEYQRNGKLRR
ncbi:MAG: hypothetical protein AB7F43_03370 [Bacteriovoracia bacterium]